MWAPLASTLNLQAELLAMFTVAQSHFWKKQKTKNNSILDLCPDCLIKVWFQASPCLYNLHCTARQHFLVEAQCVPCCSFAVSRPYVQQTLPARDTHSHNSAPPISNHQAKLLCSSQNTTSSVKQDWKKNADSVSIQICPPFSPCVCSTPVEYKHFVGEIL